MSNDAQFGKFGLVTLFSKKQSSRLVKFWSLLNVNPNRPRLELVRDLDAEIVAQNVTNHLKLFLETRNNELNKNNLL